MSQPDIMKVTEHEVQNRPDALNGDVEVTRITEVKTGPGPLPPKSTSQGERIRITEVESGPLQHNTVPAPSVLPLVTPVASSSISDPAAQIPDHQPTIIPSGPLTIPSGAPTASVHFAPEHVKETVTEASRPVLALLWDSTGLKVVLYQSAGDSWTWNDWQYREGNHSGI
jgi:hypothetical protein